MKYEEARKAATGRLCSIHQDLPHKCPGCPVAKECWAGYQIEAGRMTAEDFRIWIDSQNAAFTAAVNLALEI